MSNDRPGGTMRWLAPALATVLVLSVFTVPVATATPHTTGPCVEAGVSPPGVGIGSNCALGGGGGMRSNALLIASTPGAVLVNWTVLDQVDTSEVDRFDIYRGQGTEDYVGITNTGKVATVDADQREYVDHGGASSGATWYKVVALSETGDVVAWSDSYVGVYVSTG